MAGTQGGAALAARATALRTELAGRFRTEQSRIVGELDGARAAKVAADATAVEAQVHVRQRTEEGTAIRRRVTELQREADALEAKGLTIEAAEVREQVQGNLARAGTAHDLVVAAERRLAAAKAEATTQSERVVALRKERDDLGPTIQAAEGQLDRLDTKAAYLQESEVHAANAVRLHAEADRLRAAGQDAEADRLVGQSVGEDIAAQAKQASADELVVDLGPVRAAGIDAPDLALADPGADPISGATALAGEPADTGGAPLVAAAPLADLGDDLDLDVPDLDVPDLADPLVASFDADPGGALGGGDDLGGAGSFDDLAADGGLDGPPDLDLDLNT